LEVVGSDGFGRLDLDAYYAASVVLEQDVDLILVSVPVVEQPRLRVGPCELTTQFADDESFQQATNGRLGHSARGDAAGETGVDEHHLRRPDGAGRRAGRPGRDTSHQEDRLQDLDVVAHRRRAHPEVGRESGEVEQAAALRRQQRH